MLTRRDERGDPAPFRADRRPLAGGLLLLLALAGAGCVVYDKEGNIDKEATRELNETWRAGMQATAEAAAAGAQAWADAEGGAQPMPAGGQQWVPCPACRGAGGIPCPYCRGAGHYFGTICGACGGAGGVPCQNCGGSGRILARPPPY